MSLSTALGGLETLLGASNPSGPGWNHHLHYLFQDHFRYTVMKSLLWYIFQRFDLGRIRVTPKGSKDPVARFVSENAGCESSSGLLVFLQLHLKYKWALLLFLFCFVFKGSVLLPERLSPGLGLHRRALWLGRMRQLEAYKMQQHRLVWKPWSRVR